MKNAIVFFGIFFCILLAKVASSQVAVNVSGGLNISSLKSSSSYSENKVKAGINFGVTSDISVNEAFGIETGLVFSTKGKRSIYKYIDNTNWWYYDTTTYKTSVNINYLILPVKATGTLNAGNVNFVGSFGPYFGLAVGGRSKTDETTNGNTISYTNNIKFGKSPMNSNIRRFDYGLSMGVGLNSKNFHMGVSYDLGLANLSPSKDAGNFAKNRSWSIDMGYRFDYGNLNSQDYNSRLRAVKRIKKQEKLFTIVMKDSDWRVRHAAFKKLDNNSLNNLIEEANDSALILAAKIRMGQISWSEAFSGKNNQAMPLNSVIGAAALVDSPRPSSYDVVSACHNFIQLGDASRIPELIFLLNNYGDVSLAEDYMNCGESTLEAAGCSWGRSRGYECTTGYNGSNRVRWGSKK
jgi:hypothetical protein